MSILLLPRHLYTNDTLFFTVYSAQLTAVTEESIEILSNTEIIAINQDPVEGKSIVPFRWGVNVSLAYVSSLHLLNMVIT